MESLQSRVIGALLLSAVCGFMDAVIAGVGNGIICGIFVFVALVVARNL